MNFQTETEFKNDTFCPLPWAHLSTRTSGKIAVCCEMDYAAAGYSRNIARDRDFHLSRDSIKAAFNSEYFKEIRLKLLNGEVPRACKPCFHRESLGVKSKRQYEMDRHEITEAKARELTNPDGTIHPSFQSVELRLGNLCNLKCRSCGAYSSSKWWADHLELMKSLDFVEVFDPKMNTTWIDHDPFWNELGECSPELTHIYINGGEPMLVRAHWALLERFAQSGQSKKMSLLYSTNMSVLPPETERIWAQFREVKVMASVDDIGRRVEYIRNPVKWDVIQENLARMRSWGVDLVLSQTVSIYNFFYLDEFARWADANGYAYMHNYLREPFYLRPDLLSPQAREKVLAKVVPALTPDLGTNLANMWSSASDEKASWDRFLQYTRKLDLMRNESFHSTFPEFTAFLENEGWQIP